MDNNDILKQYDDAKTNNISFARAIKSLVGVLLSTNDIETHSISSRVKDRDSLEEKIEGEPKYSSLADIPDIVGLRVVTFYSDTVDDIADIIKKEFDIDQDHFSDKRAEMEPDRFGYLSVHYVVSLDEARAKLTENKKYQGMKAEIQIRSILQHAWAEISHKTTYKSLKAVPEPVKRQFPRLAGLLELADEEFIRIREATEDYSDEVGEKIEKVPQLVTIDAISLKNFIENDKDVQRLDKEIVKLYAIKLFPTKDLSDTLKGLEYFGINSIAHITQLLKENEKYILRRARDNGKVEEFTETGTGIAINLLGQVLAARTKNKKKIVNYLTTIQFPSGEYRDTFVEYLLKLTDC